MAASYVLLLLLLLLQLCLLFVGAAVGRASPPLHCQAAHEMGTVNSQHVWVNSQPNATHTFVMLLGVAYSGTSATHSLFEHGNSNVAVLKVSKERYQGRACVTSDHQHNPASSRRPR